MEWTMTAEQQHRARQALAFVVGALRPDWDPPGTIAAIEALHRDRQPLGTVARAAIDAALTPTTKTPGGIAARIRDGFTGAADTAKATPTPPRVSHMRCTRCGFTVTEPDHKCSPRADVETAREAVVRAKASIRGES